MVAFIGLQGAPLKTEQRKTIHVNRKRMISTIVLNINPIHDVFLSYEAKFVPMLFLVQLQTTLASGMVIFAIIRSEEILFHIISLELSTVNSFTK